MSNVLRLALVDPNKATRDVVKSTVMDLSTVWLEAECSRYEFFVDAVKQAAPGSEVVLDGGVADGPRVGAGRGNRLGCSRHRSPRLASPSQ